MSARIPPLPRDRWDDAVEAALRSSVPPAVGDQFMSTGPDHQRVPNAISSLMYNPQLAGPFLAFNGVLLREPKLEPRLRELMVLMVARHSRSQYEWVQHATRLGPRHSVTTAELEAIVTGWRTGTWTPLEADLLDATEQLLETTHIDDPTWARLAAQLDEATLIEALFVVGTYTCLAMVLNGVQVELDPELDPAKAPSLPATSN
jgi:alkylhydroperoxidase family enzyme